MATGRTRDDGRRDEDTRQHSDEPEYAEVSAAEAAREGLRQIVGLTGKEPLGVTSVEATEDGWMVGVEVVEETRIPSSTDMLGLYEVDLDLTGDLLGYRRTQRYQRGKGDGR
jgi:hypothetical protein